MPGARKLLESVGLIDAGVEPIAYESVEKHEIRGVRVEFEFVAGQNLVATFTFDNTDEGKAALKLFQDYLAGK